MVRTYRPRVPARFGEITAAGVRFGCRRCGRSVAYARAEAVRLWGELGRIADVAASMRCRNCGAKGAKVEIEPSRAVFGEGETLGQRARKQMTAVDRLVADLGDIRPSGEVH